MSSYWLLYREPPTAHAAGGNRFLRIPSTRSLFGPTAFWMIDSISLFSSASRVCPWTANVMVLVSILFEAGNALYTSGSNTRRTSSDMRSIGFTSNESFFENTANCNDRADTKRYTSRRVSKYGPNPGTNRFGHRSESQRSATDFSSK